MDSSPTFLVFKALVAFCLSFVAITRATKLTRRKAAPLAWWGYWLFGACSFGLIFSGLQITNTPIMPRFFAHMLVIGFMLGVLLILLAESKNWSQSGGPPNHLLKWQWQYPQHDRRSGADRRRVTGTQSPPPPGSMTSARLTGRWL